MTEKTHFGLILTAVASKLKTESKTIAWSGASGSPLGAGTSLITAFKISFIPNHVFQDAGIILSLEQPIKSTI